MPTVAYRHSFYRHSSSPHLFLNHLIYGNTLHSYSTFSDGFVFLILRKSHLSTYALVFRFQRNWQFHFLLCPLSAPVLPYSLQFACCHMVISLLIPDQISKVSCGIVPLFAIIICLFIMLAHMKTGSCKVIISLF